MVIEKIADSDEAFLFVGNHACLDFINTEIVVQGERVDLLRRYEDLAAWLLQAGLLEAQTVEAAVARWQESEEGKQAFAQALVLRRLMRRAAEAMAVGEALPLESLEAVNAILRLRVGYTQLEPALSTCERRSRYQLTEPIHLLAPVAEAAADLFCTSDPTLVKRCENPACILFFYDTTKNHARRWCSMSACGNRMKAAAHYRRSRQ